MMVKELLRQEEYDEQEDSDEVNFIIIYILNIIYIYTY